MQGKGKSLTDPGNLCRLHTTHYVYEVSAGSNVYEVSAGSNVLRSFCEQVTTGANVLRFLVVHIIDFAKFYCGSNCYIFFGVYFIIDFRCK